jgi:hypothetical protein
MSEHWNIDIDWTSPEGERARVLAFRLIAARMGAGRLVDDEGQAPGRAALAQEFTRVFREVFDESESRQDEMTLIANLVNALVEISRILLVVVRLDEPGLREMSDEDILALLDRGFDERWSVSDEAPE